MAGSTSDTTDVGAKQAAKAREDAANEAEKRATQRAKDEKDDGERAAEGEDVAGAAAAGNANTGATVRARSAPGGTQFKAPIGATDNAHDPEKGDIKVDARIKEATKGLTDAQKQARIDGTVPPPMVNAVPHGTQIPDTTGIRK